MHPTGMHSCCNIQKHFLSKTFTLYLTSAGFIFREFDGMPPKQGILDVSLNVFNQMFLLDSRL